MAETMKDIMHPGSGTKRDARFPHAPEEWTQTSAKATASAEGIELTDDHWALVGALQEYFAKNETPHVRALHDALDEKFHAKGGLKYLYKLFPGGPVAQGCRVAGLHPPPGSSDESFGSVQ